MTSIQSQLSTYLAISSAFLLAFFLSVWHFSLAVSLEELVFSTYSTYSPVGRGNPLELLRAILYRCCSGTRELVLKASQNHIIIPTTISYGMAHRKIFKRCSHVFLVSGLWGTILWVPFRGLCLIQFSKVAILSLLPHRMKQLEVFWKYSSVAGSLQNGSSSSWRFYASEVMTLKSIFSRSGAIS